MASFDENGKYIKTNWKAGDKITATKLNKIEESIEAVNDNDISRHVEADARLDALEAKDVAHDKEFTKVKNLIEDAKDAAELGDYEINSRMTFLEEELNEGIEEVHNVANTVDGKINQGKADMEAMVAEVEADLEGLHAKDEELSGEIESVNSQLAHKTNYVTLEQFGAVGDGVTDDTEAFKNLINYIDSLNNYSYDGYTLRDCSKIKLVFNGLYAIKETITFPNLYSLVLDGLRVKALDDFKGDVLLNFSGVVIDSNIINCNIDGNLKTNTILFSNYNANINLSNNNIHHFTDYGLKMINKGHEMKVIGNKIYQYTWGEFVNSTPALSTGVGLVIDSDRHDNRFTDNVICYCNENLLILEGGTNTFVNNHFYNGKKEDTFLGVYGSYNEFNSCYFDGVYINLYAYNNIKNSLFMTNKNANCFIKLNSSNADLWTLSLTSILGNKFKSLNKIDTPFVANGFDFENLKCNIYDNVYDNVTPFSLIPSPAYNPSPFNQFKRSLKEEGYEVVGEVKYMWGSCVAYTQKTLDCSKILNVQLTLTEEKATIPFVTIRGNTFTPKGDGTMNYFAVCVI